MGRAGGLQLLIESINIILFYYQLNYVIMVIKYVEVFGLHDLNCQFYRTQDYISRLGWGITAIKEFDAMLWSNRIQRESKGWSHTPI